MTITTGGLIREAWAAVRAHGWTAFRISVIPFALLFVLGWLESAGVNVLVGLVTGFLTDLLCSVVAVRLQRLILIGEMPPARNFGFAVGPVELAYAIWVFLLTDLPLSLTKTLSASFPGLEGAYGWMLIASFVGLFCAIFFIRNFAVLPAVALSGAPARADFKAAFLEASSASRPAWWPVLFAEMAYGIAVMAVFLPLWALPRGDLDWAGRLSTAAVGAAAALVEIVFEAAIVSKAYAALDLSGTSLPRPRSGDIDPA